VASLSLSLRERANADSTGNSRAEIFFLFISLEKACAFYPPERERERERARAEVEERENSGQERSFEFAQSPPFFIFSLSFSLGSRFFFTYICLIDKRSDPLFVSLLQLALLKQVNFKTSRVATKARAGFSVNAAAVRFFSLSLLCFVFFFLVLDRVHRKNETNTRKHNQRD